MFWPSISNVVRGPMSEYGSDPNGGFNAATKLYKANPTLENYLKLRRENPDAEIEVGIHGGIDQLFYMENEFKKFGIDPNLMECVLDGCPGCTSRLALHFMEKIVESKAKRKKGESQLIRRGRAIPDKLIDWFIMCALDSLSWNGFISCGLKARRTPCF